MEPKRIGKLVFRITVSTEKMADALKRLRETMERVRLDFHRADWWKRSDGPPDWIADLNEPEWWDNGDEPPEWGCAA